MESKKDVSPTREQSPTRKASSARKESPSRKVSPTRKQSPIRRISPTRNVTATSELNVPNPSGQFMGGTESFEHFKQFDFQNIYKDPLVNIFNSVFTRDTHKCLGLSGMKVSRITLGSMNFGQLDPQFGERPGQLDENKAHQILDRFVELGGNCIDTANFFPWFGKTSGESERIIGNWLSKRSDRERLVIISKIRLPTDPTNAKAIGLSRTNVINSVENILRRLQTNYIDLLQIDGWDYTVHLDEIIRVFDELLMSGKVRNMGVCDFKGWQLQRIMDRCKMLNKHKVCCYQSEYNLLSRGSEMEVVDVCLNESLGFIAYSPFKYGFLTEAYENRSITQPVEGTRLEATTGQYSNLSGMGEPFEITKQNPAFSKLIPVLKNIAINRNLPIQNIALRWILQQDFVSSVVVGVNSVEELEESMKVLTDFCLSEEEMFQLDVASLPYLPYPYLTTSTEYGRKLFAHTPGPIVYSQMAYLTQALTLNDRMFDFGYPESFYVKNSKPLTILHPKSSKEQPWSTTRQSKIQYQQNVDEQNFPYGQQQQQYQQQQKPLEQQPIIEQLQRVPLEQQVNVESNIKNIDQLVQQPLGYQHPSGYPESVKEQIKST